MKTPQLIDWMCFLTLTTRLTAKTQRGPRGGEKQRGYFRAPDADDAVVGTDNFASLVQRPSKLAQLQSRYGSAIFLHLKKINCEKTQVADLSSDGRRAVAAGVDKFPAPGSCPWPPWVPREGPLFSHPH